MTVGRQRPGIAAPRFLTTTAAMLRTCPICQTPPNRRCRRWVAGRVTDSGKLINLNGEGGYWKPLEKIHPERAGRKPKQPRKHLDRYYPTATPQAPSTEGNPPDA
jgi:hypothetical protein